MSRADVLHVDRYLDLFARRRVIGRVHSNAGRSAQEAFDLPLLKPGAWERRQRDIHAHEVVAMEPRTDGTIRCRSTRVRLHVAGDAGRESRGIRAVRVLDVGLLDSDANGFILIACDEHDLPIGYAAVSTGWSLEVGGADYILDEIFVQQRGEGIGRQLINAAEDRCAELGVRRIFLETERPNDRARSLCARLGFVEDDSVWMSKDL